jgi:hypothetical protein
MSDFDFNEAEPQRAGGGELIPDNTLALVVSKIRPGGNGPGGYVRNSDSGCEMLDFEFTVDGGDHDRRKFWSLFIVSGVTEGQQKAANITRSRLRAMLESARGINPSDTSPEAVKGRQADGWGAFDGLAFCVKIGVEQGGLKDKSAGPQSERYADKNVIKAVITPDEDHYIPPSPQAKAAGAASKPANDGKAAAAAVKPAWAS